MPDEIQCSIDTAVELLVELDPLELGKARPVRDLADNGNKTGTRGE